jgi:dihydroorotate dehydrogenase (NAD+) catalytic subunit
MKQPAFYDNTLSYEDNFEKGPPLLQLANTPKKRNIAKKQKFLGFDVNIPFGIPAGPLLTSEHVKTAFEFGFDVNMYKTQRSTTFPVNAFPNVLFVDVDGDLTIEKAKKPLVGRTTTDKNEKDFTITNSFGNPSKGPDFWQEDMKKAISFQGDGQLLIASVVGTIKEGFSPDDYYNDFAYTAELAHQTGVKVIEVNLSCPNVASEGVLCYNADADEVICRKIKEKIGNTPLLAKLGYFGEDQEALLQKVIERTSPFVAGYAAINTIPAPVVDERGQQALPGPNRLMSGICGAGVRWAGLDMVVHLSLLRDKLHKDFAIVGVGGVMTPDDYQKYIDAGADLVQSATGAMWNPDLAFEIWQKYYGQGV